MAIPRFVLASASPARLRLLQTVGIEPIVCPSYFDESQVQLDAPGELVETLAQRKAETVADRFTDALVMGCDSVLVVGGEIYGKPADEEEAIARWQKMRSSYGDLYTGHALIDLTVGAAPRERPMVRTQITRVYFASASDRLIKAYVATGEPLKCAGGFALEGKGGLFVEKLEGCHSNVIGLSLPLLRQMLAQLGYDITDLLINI